MVVRTGALVREALIRGVSILVRVSAPVVASEDEFLEVDPVVALLVAVLPYRDNCVGGCVVTLRRLRGGLVDCRIVLRRLSGGEVVWRRVVIGSMVFRRVRGGVVILWVEILPVVTGGRV